MRKRNLAMIPMIVALLLSSVMCTIPGITGQPETQGTVEALQTTIQALSTQQVTAVPTEGPATGSISGGLSYPSEICPEMRVVAMRVENGQATGDYQYVEKERNSETYTIEGLDPGDYWVVAYPIEDIGQAPGISGGYSQAVVCGLTNQCKDHSLVPVHVEAGKDTPEIHPGDWNVPVGTFPKDPSQ